MSANHRQANCSSPPLQHHSPLIMLILKGVFFVKGKEPGKQTYDPPQEDAAIVFYSSHISAFISVITYLSIYLSANLSANLSIFLYVNPYTQSSAKLLVMSHKTYVFFNLLHN